MWMYVCLKGLMKKVNNVHRDMSTLTPRGSKKPSKSFQVTPVPVNRGNLEWRGNLECPAHFCMPYHVSHKVSDIFPPFFTRFSTFMQPCTGEILAVISFLYHLYQGAFWSASQYVLCIITHNCALRKRDSLNLSYTSTIQPEVDGGCIVMIKMPAVTKSSQSPTSEILI